MFEDGRSQYVVHAIREVRRKLLERALFCRPSNTVDNDSIERSA